MNASRDGEDLVGKQASTLPQAIADGEDASKVVKTVKSFRELKALYEAKSTAPTDGIPAKPPGSIAKRFPPPGSPAASPAVSSARLSSSGNMPTKPVGWKKNEGRSGSFSSSASPSQGLEESPSPLAPSAVTATASTPSTASTARMDLSPESSPSSSGSVAAARRTDAKTLITPGSPRTWSRTAVKPTASNSATATSLANGTTSAASEPAAEGEASASGVGGTWLKRLNVEKTQAEREVALPPDSGRGRNVSISIEKGKVASVKEKFLGGKPQSSGTASTSNSGDQLHISERGRVTSSELKDVIARERGMESPRVSELIRGLSRSQDQPDQLNVPAAHGGPFRSGSGTMTRSSPASTKEHNRSHSDTIVSDSHASHKGSLTSPTVSDDAICDQPVKSSAPTDDASQEPLPSWAIRWQHRLQEKERERERDKERLAEAIRSRGNNNSKEEEQPSDEGSRESETTSEISPSDSSHHDSLPESTLNEEAGAGAEARLQERTVHAQAIEMASESATKPISEDSASKEAEATAKEESTSSVPDTPQDRQQSASSTAEKRMSGVYDQVLELIGEEEITRALNSPPPSPLMRPRKPDPRRLSRSERLSSSPERRGSVIERSIAKSSSDEEDSSLQRGHGSAIGIRRATISTDKRERDKEKDASSTGTLRRHSKESTAAAQLTSSPTTTVASPKPPREEKADLAKQRRSEPSSSSGKRKEGEPNQERDRLDKEKEREDRDKDREKDRESDREKRDRDKDRERDREKERPRDKDRERERDRDKEKDREAGKEKERERSDREKEKDKERERERERDNKERDKDRKDRSKREDREEKERTTTSSNEKKERGESRSVSSIDRRGRNRKEDSTSALPEVRDNKRKDRTSSLSPSQEKRPSAKDNGDVATVTSVAATAGSPHRERRKEGRVDKESNSHALDVQGARTEGSPRAPSALLEIRDGSPRSLSALRTEESPRRGSADDKVSSKPSSSVTKHTSSPRNARNDRGSKENEAESDRERDKDKRDKERGERDRERERDKERKRERDEKAKDKPREREKDEKPRDEKETSKDRNRERKDKERERKSNRDQSGNAEVTTTMERKDREDRSRDKERREAREKDSKDKEKERREEREKDRAGERRDDLEQETVEGYTATTISSVMPLEESRDSDSEDISAGGEIVEVDSEDVREVSSSADEAESSRNASHSDIPEAEDAHATTDEAGMKRYFVEFMNQYYETKSTPESSDKMPKVDEGLRKSRSSSTSSSLRPRQRPLHVTRERLDTDPRSRPVYRESIGSRSEMEDHLTETDITAFSEYESETEYGTETEGEADMEMDIDEMSERSRKRDRVSHQVNADDIEECEVEGENASDLSESDKINTDASNNTTSTATAPVTNARKFGKKDDFSSSPAAALFGSPKKKSSRYSVLFGKASDDRKQKNSQSRRSMYTAFLSRTTSHGGADPKKSMQPRSSTLSSITSTPTSASQATNNSSLSSSPPSAAVNVPLSSLVAENTGFHASTDGIVPLRPAGHHHRASFTMRTSPKRYSQDGPEADSSGGSSIAAGSDVSSDEAPVNEKNNEGEAPDVTVAGGNGEPAKSNLSKIEEKAKAKRLNFDEAVQLFNESKPTRAVRLLITNGFLRGDAEDIARFLHSANNSLDKEKLGILLAENEDIFPDVLKAFIDQMDFQMYDFDVALRKLLFTFRLPGEAQKIDRIVKVWANHWWEQNPGLLPLMKCAYVLAYAVIMLNTDAHNEMVRYKMTLKEFLVNVANNDGGELIPQPFLEDIYPRIVEEEIKMEDEGALFPTACKKGWLQVRSKKAFHTWKRRWVVLTTDRLHILRKIGDKHPLQSIPLDNLLMNTPIKEQGRKFLLFLYHAPTDHSSGHRADASAGPHTGTLKERTLKSQQGSSSSSVPRRGQRGELLDLNDRVVTVLCAFEKEVFDAWVASITRNIGIKSRLKKVSSTKF